MAKLQLIIEDVGEHGDIALRLVGDDTFKPNMDDWTSAQRAAMWAYHALGTPTQDGDLATTDTEGAG